MSQSRKRDGIVITLIQITYCIDKLNRLHLSGLFVRIVLIDKRRYIMSAILPFAYFGGLMNIAKNIPQTFMQFMHMFQSFIKVKEFCDRSDFSRSGQKHIVSFNNMNAVGPCKNLCILLFIIVK